MRHNGRAVTFSERAAVALWQLGYLAAIYSGLRAGVNVVRSGFCVRGVEAARRIQGAGISSLKLGDLVVGVHSRACPPSGTDEARYGMISVRLRRPSMPRLLYRYFCLTSHFGSGHLEIAFYERGQKITFYAVRNIARSNARRLGLTKMADQLRLTHYDEELELIMEAATLLERQGLVAQFAPAEECIDLAVCRRLLPPAGRARVLETLERKYERLHRRMRQRLPGRVEVAG